jgi:hypothetical protein
MFCNFISSLPVKGGGIIKLPSSSKQQGVYGLVVIGSSFDSEQAFQVSNGYL